MSSYLFILWNSLLYICLTAHIQVHSVPTKSNTTTRQNTPTGKKSIPQKRAPNIVAKTVPCQKQAPIPHEKNFLSLDLPAAQATILKNAWGNMYAAYLAKCASTTQNSNEWSALKRQAFINNPFCEYTPLGQDPAQIQNLDVCLDLPPKDQSIDIRNCQTNIANAYQALTINYLEMMEASVSSQTFQKLQNDPLGINYHYATTHLQKALSRLAQISSISLKDDTPITTFSGDIKDLGIIVNITNNTGITFRISQGTTTTTPIAQINTGLNGVNLYTAALYQDPAKSSQTQPVFYCYPVSGPANYQSSFTIGIYSGQELINFLKTLPRKDPAIFEMNGCPTSEQYLANPTDLYMVLIQDPTRKGAQERNPSQRIQAINLSVLTGPYLLTMQINEIEVEETDPQTKQKKNLKILQPAFTTVQVIQAPSTTPTAAANSIKQSISNAAGATTTTSSSTVKETTPVLNSSLLPLIILPEFLWNIPTLQMYWMLYTTSYISALTDYSLFGPSKFGSAFDYYEDLGYFSIDYEHRFMIDKYNVLQAGQTLYDCPSLMNCIVYETTLKNCSDIPVINITGNSRNDIVANSPDAAFLNIQVGFNPNKKTLPTNNFFSKYGFNNTYSLPYHMLYTLFFSLPIDQVQKIFFVTIEKEKNIYTVSWKDKNGTVLNSQYLYINFPFDQINISFLTTLKNWIGTSIAHTSKLSSDNNYSQEFKILYENSNKQFRLIASVASPIDKVDYIHTIEFSKYPLTEIYYDLFHTYHVLPFIRFYLFQNGALPYFLQNLSMTDWQQGVYLIPFINNNESVSTKQPEPLTITCYKADGTTTLGVLNLKHGLLNNSQQTEVIQPISIYDIHSPNFKSTYQVYLTSGILLQYKGKNE